MGFGAVTFVRYGLGPKPAPAGFFVNGRDLKSALRALEKLESGFVREFAGPKLHCGGKTKPAMFRAVRADDRFIHEYFVPSTIIIT